MDKELTLVFGLFMGFVENKKSTEYHRTYSFNPEIVSVEISWDPVPTKERLLAKKRDVWSENIQKSAVTRLCCSTRRPCGLLKREMEERDGEFEGFGACCIVFLPKEE